MQHTIEPRYNEVCAVKDFVALQTLLHRGFSQGRSQGGGSATFCICALRKLSDLRSSTKQNEKSRFATCNTAATGAAWVSA